MIALFTRVILRLTAYYYYVTQSSEAVVRNCFVKKAFLEISKNSQENDCARLWQRCFPVNFAKFLRTFFLTEHLRWPLLAFQSESTLYSFRTFCSKQAQYLKFKCTKTSWKYNRLNIVQTSFCLLCCGLLDSFNENVLRQGGLDKYF